MSGKDRPTPRRRAVVATEEEIRVSPPGSDESDGPENTEVQEGRDAKENTDPPAGPPPNGGGQVPVEAGTQVGTSPGTQLGRTEDKQQEERQGGSSDSLLDFSMRAALAEEKDPEQDWIKSGWQAKRYRKAAVRAAVKFKWKGYKEEQDVIDAALDAYIPKQLSDEARNMAQRGEL